MRVLPDIFSERDIGQLKCLGPRIVAAVTLPYILHSHHVRGFDAQTTIFVLTGAVQSIRLDVVRYGCEISPIRVFDLLLVSSFPLIFLARENNPCRVVGGVDRTTNIKVLR